MAGQARFDGDRFDDLSPEEIDRRVQMHVEGEGATSNSVGWHTMQRAWMDGFIHIDVMGHMEIDDAEGLAAAISLAKTLRQL